MKAKAKRMRTSDNLRARAEDSLRKRRMEVIPESAEDVQRLVHELQVHEIELQMQNDELRRTHQELEEAYERYAHLYDFAPCAYLTLSVTGEIQEANLTAATLLGVERNRLIKQKFTRFIRPDSQDEFYLYGHLVLASGIRQTTQLELKSAKDTRLIVRIDGIAEASAGILIAHRAFASVVTDITDSKKSEE